jgi:hypothetical protein
MRAGGIRAASAAFLAAAALLLAGCGGSNTDASTDDTNSALVAMPTPQTPVSAEIAAFERSFDKNGCKQFQPLLFSTIRRRPAGSPATAAECRGRDSETARLARLISLPILSTRQYGTAALLEAPGSHGAEKDYTIWVLDSDGRFHFTEIQVNDDPQFETSFTNRDEARRVAGDLVRAVDQHDCKALLALLDDSSRLVVERSPQEICQSVLDGRYFAPAVHATPKPAIEVIGGTQALAFVGVPTKNAYFTITMAAGDGGDLRVFDVLPNTPLEPAES